MYPESLSRFKAFGVLVGATLCFRMSYLLIGASFASANFANVSTKAALSTPFFDPFCAILVKTTDALSATRFFANGCISGVTMMPIIKQKVIKSTAF
jgi:hypothetical protein